MSCTIFKLCDISDAGGEGVEKAGIKAFFYNYLVVIIRRCRVKSSNISGSSTYEQNNGKGHWGSANLQQKQCPETTYEILYVLICTTIVVK